ncbi:response regulator [Cohnella silvisoli]|uniref:Response regulator n=1 Tax=Cohnella silvisoli TaxID=2873699 RepID=A0ABV1KLJ6_9BACL|nr:response regulator [Cohnella silvisoli]MCD9020669.1 response regulator [Cohnella silvisoli]
MDLKVLLVEDERFILEGLAAIVESMGPPFSLAGYAANGLEAIKLLKDLEPDIVVTDVQMPGMDGLELLHHLRTFHSEIVSIVVSGYDDYHYMRKAIQSETVDYLLKPLQPEELQTALRLAAERRQALSLLRGGGDDIYYQFNRLLPYIHEKWFDQWIHGEQPLLDERFYGDLRLFEMKNLRLGIVHIDYSARTDWQGDYRLAHLAAFQVMKESVQGEQGVKCFLSRHNEMMFVGIHSEIKGSALEIAVDRMKRNIEDHLRVPVFIGISSDCPDIFHMSEAYPEVRRLSFSRMITPAQVTYADHICLYEKELGFQEAANGFLLGRDREAISHVIGITERFRRNSESSEERSQFLYRLSLCVWKAVSHNLLSTEAEEALFRIFKTAAISEEWERFSNELRVWTEEASAASSFSGKQYHVLVQKAIRYIEEHYADTITLTFMAGYVHLNPAYFSALFKQEMEVNFVDYLNQVRIRSAQALLKDYSMKIYEVAGKVGYGSTQHFMKTFRTIVGITPSEYRQTLSQNVK